MTAGAAIARGSGSAKMLAFNHAPGLTSKRALTFRLGRRLGRLLTNDLAFGVPEHDAPPLELPLAAPIPHHLDGLGLFDDAHERHLEHTSADAHFDPRQGLQSEQLGANLILLVGLLCFRDGLPDIKVNPYEQLASLVQHTGLCW